MMMRQASSERERLYAQEVERKKQDTEIIVDKIISLFFVFFSFLFNLNLISLNVIRDRG